MIISVIVIIILMIYRDMKFLVSPIPGQVVPLSVCVCVCVCVVCVCVCVCVCSVCVCVVSVCV